MNENVTRYPLAWPDGWKRTADAERRHSRFTRYVQGQHSWKTHRALTYSEARKRLIEELGRLQADGAIISSNVRVYKATGEPQAGEGEKRYSDPGVAVYFELRRQARCLACDRYNTVAGNLAAIAAHIDALRAMDRYGVGTLDQAFAGYAPRLQSAAFEWWIVLGLPRSSTVDAINEAFTRLMRTAHPDAGGDPAAAARLTEARAAALAEVKS